MPHHDEVVTVLERRLDALIDDLQKGLRSFDTDSAGVRWQTVKIALRIVLAHARLRRERLGGDE